MDALPDLGPYSSVPGVQLAVDTFLRQVAEIRARPEISVVGSRDEVRSAGAQGDPITDLIVNLAGFVYAPVAPTFVATYQQLVAEHPEAAVPNYMGAVVSLLGNLVKSFLATIIGVEAAAQIDTSGDVVKLFASIDDAVSREDLLTAGPLSFAQVLQYEDRLSGMHLTLVAVSFIFSIVLGAVSLGILGSSIGLLLNLIDTTIGDSARVVSTQLVRRAVGDVYGEGYARMHRTKDLSTTEAEEAYALGMIDEARYVDVLVSGSFKDDAIQTKVALGRVRALNQAGIYPVRTKFVSAGTLASALKAGVVDDAEFLGELARQGYDDVALEIIWSLAQLKAAPPAPPGV